MRMTMPIMRILVVCCAFSLLAHAADPQVEAALKAHEDAVAKLKAETIKKIKAVQTDKMRKSDLAGANECQIAIDQLEGKKSKPAAGEAKDSEEDFEVLGKSWEGQWISRDATYELSSIQIKPKPQFLTCEELRDDVAFQTEVDPTAKKGGEWCKVDLKRVYELTRIEVGNRGESQSRTVGAELLLSIDGQKWTKVGVFKKPASKYVFPLKGKKAQYVKIQTTTANLLGLKTMKVFGE